MKTTFPVSAPPEAWAALADPQRLEAALPGCRSVTPDAAGDGTLHVVTEVAVASVRGLWAGTVAPLDSDAVRVRGSGAPGAVDLTVRADPERTALTVEGTVDGLLGTVGSVVLAAAVRRVAEGLLATTATPAPNRSRGRGLEPTEPMTAPTPHRRAARRLGGGVAAVAVVAAIIVRRRGRRGAS